MDSGMVELPSPGLISRGAAPASKAPAKVLLVDDEPAVLDALRRKLRGRLEVSTAEKPTLALDLVRDHGPFAVVVSDMQMPDMDGVVFLREMRAREPDTVRILLTGNADLQSAIGVVNEGNVFRFLCKPCQSDDLYAALTAGVEQHRLLTAERDLLERTLQGSVRALLETLSLANPTAFARAVRVRGITSDLLDAMGIDDRWHIEVASMLSQVGAVTLPPPVGDKLHRGLPLDGDEQAMVDRLPDIAATLLEEVPRLEDVVAIVRAQARAGTDEDVPVGARILRVAIDFDVLETRRIDVPTIMDTLRSRKCAYDPQVLDALARVRDSGSPRGELVEVSTSELRSGMVLASDVRTSDGVLLVGRGQEVTSGLLERIRNFSTRAPIERTVSVIVPSTRSS